MPRAGSSGVRGRARRAGRPGHVDDPARLRDLSRRHKELSEVVATWRELERAREDLADGPGRCSRRRTGDDREVVQDEVERAEASIEALGAPAQRSCCSPRIPTTAAT